MGRQASFIELRVAVADTVPLRRRRRFFATPHALWTKKFYLLLTFSLKENGTLVCLFDLGLQRSLQRNSHFVSGGAVFPED